MQRRTGFIAVLAVILTASGCASSGSGDVSVDAVYAAELPQATGSIDSATWMLAGEPGSLDPDADGGIDLSTVLANVCERLMTQQPDLTLRTGLAEAVTWLTSTSLQITLRQGVMFHDGTAMTTQDVVWSMQRHALDTSWEGDEYENVVSIQAVDDRLVVIDFSAPDSIFLQAMAGNAGIVLNPRVIEAAGSRFGQPGSDDACSGPYIVQDWAPGESITLKAAEDYWDSELDVRTRELEFIWGDATSLNSAMRAEQVQGAYLSDPTAAIALRDVDDIEIYQGPSTAVWSAIPSRPGIASDARVRQALSLAVDRSGVVKSAFGGLAQPASASIGEGSWGYEREAFSTANAELTGSPAAVTSDHTDVAAAMISDAQLTGEPVVIASDGSTVGNVISAALADAASRIGLKASLITIPPQQYGDIYDDEELRGRTDFFVDAYYISKADPVSFYKLGATSSWANFTGFDDTDYDEILAQAETTIDDAERAGRAIELQSKWNQDMRWIPIVASPNTLVLSSDLTGIPASVAFLSTPWGAGLGTE